MFGHRLALLLGSLILTGTGCQGLKSHQQVTALRPDSTPVAAHQLASQSAGDNTVILVVNGGDPLDFADADDFIERFRCSGYPNTYLVPWHRAFESGIRRIHYDHPNARLVLIGYSLGAYRVKTVAARLLDDGIPIAMVGYIGGDYLTNTSRTRLDGACRVVNITGNGHPLTGRNLLFNGTDVTGARNHRLAGTGHYDLLDHPDTFAVLLEELHCSELSAP